VADEVSEPVIEALEETWSATATACQDLHPDAWDVATDCPGWTVRDHLSHVVGTELGLLGESMPPEPDPMPDYVHNPIGQSNEAWISARRGIPGTEVLEEFMAVTTRRLGELRSFPAERWDVVGWTPIGEAPYREFMEIRAFDSWVHGQDIRWAVDRPGDRQGRGEAISIGRVALGMPFVVGRKVAPPDGVTVVFEIQGPLARTLALEMVGGRARPIDAAPAEPTVRLAMPALTFVRLGCGRESGAAALADGVTLQGDQALARAVLDAMNFMI
jgi:uncharacterized protein (TIGR03083 family)